MKNTQNIRERINKYLSDTGKNTDDLGKELDVNGSTVRRWIDGNANSIRNSNWKKLTDQMEKHYRTASHLSIDEQLLLEAYRKFSDDEKKTAVSEFGVKAAIKEARKAG